MQVEKRSGQLEPVKLEKISKRIQRAAKDLKNVDPMEVALKVVSGLYDGVSSRELDKLAIETAYSLSVKHPDYDTLATRIAISNIHKDTPSSFFDCINILNNSLDASGNKKGIIADDVFKFIKKHQKVIDTTIDYSRDYLFDYFGFKTLERSYLLKVFENKDGKVIQKIVERPQHLYMRVACGIHINDIDAALNTYELLSTMQLSHATPTMFNAGLKKNQMSSCFLIKNKEDSINGIFDTLKSVALISQSAGGIGLSVHDVRSKGSPIYGTGGKSNGLTPFLKVFNETARYVDQCFAGDTIVYTKNGPMNISDVVIGNELICDSGDFNRVNKVIRSKHTGKMVSIKVKQSLNPILVKEEHPFLVLKNQKKMTNYNVIRNRLKLGLIKPEWVEASELTTNDLIAFPIHNFEQDIPEYTEEDCRMYGLLIGDGNISLDDTTVKLYLNMGDDLDFVRSYLNNLLIPFVEYHKDENNIHNQSMYIFRWSCKSNFKFGRAMIYDQDREKIIHNSMLHLPKNKALQIIKGLIESDGHIGSKNYGEEIGGTEINLEMSSKQVVQSARYMLMRFGILTSGYNRNRIGNKSSYEDITTKKETISLRIPKVAEITNLFGIKTGDFFSYLSYDNYVYSRINQKSIVDFDDVVYDFEVLPNHNYLTEIGIAHNGGGKRKGSIAIYLEPHHADIEDFLDLRKNNGKEEMRARDLNLAIWASDLFFKEVETDGDWYLMDPNVSKGLSDVYGEEFEKLYEKYIHEGKFVKKIKARDIWSKILDSQIETGQPYICSKDAANKKSNQKNIGITTQSNLCAEIFEVSTSNEIAVCNLASISLTSCVEGKKGKRSFNFKKLMDITKIAVENLNKVIDIEYYPVEEARTSNLRHRPIGIGIQGLANVFALLRIPFDGEDAKKLNKDIAEAMYFAGLEKSCELSEKSKPYETFQGSPASKGILQFDMWDVVPSENYKWNELKEKIKLKGLKNSLLFASMPTASSSQVLGNVECFEPFSSNIYKRATLSGEFIQVNKYLVEDLIELGLWTDELRQEIIINEGSIQNIKVIPDEIKTLYKTVWEISQKILIDMSADRGAFTCQSQSLNLYFKNANYAKLTSAYFYAWKKGLKTIVYYTRTSAALEASKFSVDKELENRIKAEKENPQLLSDNETQNQEDLVCSLDNPEECIACGS